MTAKTVAAAKRAKASAARAKEKLEHLAALQKEEAAAKLAADAAEDVREAADAAAEVEAETQRQLELQAKLEKEDPSLWAQFKKWF